MLSGLETPDVRRAPHGLESQGKAGSAAIPSVGAAVASLLTLACCLPVGILAGFGLAGAAVLLTGARPWLGGLSVILLGVGFYQVRRGMRCGARPSVVSMFLLGLAAVIVVLAILFPQVIAGWLADWGGGGR